MRNLRLLGFAFVCTLFLASCSEQPTSVNSRASSPVQKSNPVAAQQFLVEFSGSSANLRQSVAALGGTVTRVIDAVRIATVTGISDAQADQLAKAAGVTTVTRDMALKFVPTLAEAHGVVASAVQGSTQNAANPTGAYFYQLGWQWNMDEIHGPEAWQVTSGSSEVRVGVLDTGGSPTHIDLQGKYDQSVCYNFSFPIDLNTGAQNGPYDPNDWQDRMFHGTHVAGTIAGNCIGVASVAPKTTLVAVKVLNDDGVGYFEWMMAGVVYAVDVAHVNIINMSLGGEGPRTASGRLLGMLAKTINYARSKGVLVVCAAGNSAVDLDHSGNWTFIPAESGAAMAVSATGPVFGVNPDQFACYSNYGTSTIAVAAPGGNINCELGQLNSVHDLVLAPLAPALAPGGATNYYVWAAGTSMATPHVAGVAALIAAKYGMTSAGGLQSRIQNTADDLGTPGVDPYYGKGRVNAYKAVK